MRFFKNETSDFSRYSPEPCTESQLLSLTESFRGNSKIKFVAQGDALFVEAVSIGGRNIVIGHLDRSEENE